MSEPFKQPTDSPQASTSLCTCSRENVVQSANVQRVQHGGFLWTTTTKQVVCVDCCAVRAITSWVTRETMNGTSSAHTLTFKAHPYNP